GRASDQSAKSIDKTTLSRNLKLLERRRWITFAPGSDARERRVSLASAGRGRLNAARPAWRAAREALRTALQAREWSGTQKTIDSITRAARIARRVAANHTPAPRRRFVTTPTALTGPRRGHRIVACRPTRCQLNRNSGLWLGLGIAMYS